MEKGRNVVYRWLAFLTAILLIMFTKDCALEQRQRDVIQETIEKANAELELYREINSQKTSSEIMTTIPYYTPYGVKEFVHPDVVAYNRRLLDAFIDLDRERDIMRRIECVGLLILSIANGIVAAIKNAKDTKEN